jgi:RimJ/RimL family protein N-acetyltransferase
VADVLITERLILRPVTAEDQAVLQAHWDTPDVRRFLFDGAMLSPAEITETIMESRRGFAAAGYGLWLVSERDGTELVGTELVGTAGLRPLEDLGLEIFYSLAPAPGAGVTPPRPPAPWSSTRSGHFACPRCWPRWTRATRPPSRSSSGSA